MSSDPRGIESAVTGGARLRGRRRVVRCLWLALCALCLSSSLVFAQMTEKGEKGDSPVSPAGESEQSPIGSSASSKGPPRIRNVYIPADQLKVLFGSSSKGVLMPRDKILALWREGRSHVQTETVPPADAVLAQAAYEARLADHELRVTG
ncbi:MAG: hypothetical protein HQ582_33645, partial [Planctomycetes bacterium]|nr:hypothetical protein [Planctomycetota bacterium]